MPTLIHLPEPHASARQIADDPGRFNVLMCGRQWGKTTFGKDRAIVLPAAGKVGGWFAPAYKYLNEVWHDVERALAPLAVTVDKQMKQIRTASGGVLDFWSFDNNPDAGRGRTYDFVVIDECQLIPNFKLTWYKTIRATLIAKRGIGYLLGTTKGQDDFWQMYEMGLDGRDGFKSWKLPTSSNPFIPADELAQIRRAYEESGLLDVYLQEYECIPAEDGGNPFGLKAIADCVGEMSTEPIVCWAWDLAKSVDWTVGIGLDARCRVAGFERFQMPWNETKERILAVTNAPAIVDQTGVGNAVVEDLQRSSGLFTGFTFTATSRQEILFTLRRALHGRSMTYPDGPIRRELDSTRYGYRERGVRYEVPNGMHDDCLVTLAMARHFWEQQEFRVDPLVSTSLISEDRMRDLIREERAREAAILAEEMAKAGMAATVEDEDRGWRSF